MAMSAVKYPVGDYTFIDASSWDYATVVNIILFIPPYFTICYLFVASLCMFISYFSCSYNDVASSFTACL